MISPLTDQELLEYRIASALEDLEWCTKAGQMTTRRNFLKFSTLLVPAAAFAPRVAYSFLSDKMHIGIDLGRGVSESGAVLVYAGDYSGVVWSVMRAHALKEFARRDVSNFIRAGIR